MAKHKKKDEEDYVLAMLDNGVAITQTAEYCRQSIECASKILEHGQDMSAEEQIRFTRGSIAMATIVIGVFPTGPREKDGGIPFGFHVIKGLAAMTADAKDPKGNGPRTLSFPCVDLEDAQTMEREFGDGQRLGVLQ